MKPNVMCSYRNQSNTFSALLLTDVIIVVLLVACVKYESRLKSNANGDSGLVVTYSFDALLDTMPTEYSVAQFIEVNSAGEGLDGEAAEGYGYVVTEKMWNETTRCRTLDMIGTLPDSSTRNVVLAIASEYVIRNEGGEMDSLIRDLNIHCIDTTRRTHRRALSLLRAEVNEWLGVP